MCQFQYNPVEELQVCEGLERTSGQRGTRYPYCARLVALHEGMHLRYGNLQSFTLCLILEIMNVR